MRVDNVKSNTFGAIHYLKKPMSVAGERIGSKTLHEIVDRKPDILLKQIVETSDFFKSLGKDADVFISTQRSHYKRNMFKEFTATFMDPYDKSKVTPDEFNIQVECPNDEVFYNKLDKIIMNLPHNYTALKDKYANNNPRVILGFPNYDWFITQGRNNAPKIR